jgi:hypothetical protein
MTKQEIEQLVALRLEGKTWTEIAVDFPEHTPNALRKRFYREVRDNKRKEQAVTPPKILLLDVETAPLEVFAWGLFDQNIALNQIIKHSSILSWSAKWLGSSVVMYEDTSAQKNVRDDSRILKSIWKLIDEADILIFQNGISFDRKVLNARFIENGLQPPSSCRYIDTMRIAKKHFKFTSNKLEHLTKTLCTDHRKLAHAKFPGFKLWEQCLAGNAEAWAEMKEYNEMDVLSMEELYYKLRPWDSSINFNVFHNDFHFQCSCGSTNFRKNGYVYTNSAKYVRYICKDCGAESRDTDNLLIKEKRKSLRK